MSSSRVYVSQTLLETAMASKLNQSLIYSKESDPYYDPDFCQVLDSHKEWLRTAGAPTYQDIDVKFLGQYRGDFFSALFDLGIDARYHRITMLLNGLTNPSEYTGQFTSVFVPDPAKISQILSAYNTGKRKLALDVIGD